MIVTCEQCQARFKLADEKIKPEGTKVRCSKCQSIFTVFPSSSFGTDSGDDAESPGASPSISLATSTPPPETAESFEESVRESEPAGGTSDSGGEFSAPVVDSPGVESLSFAGAIPPEAGREEPAWPETSAAEQMMEPASSPAEFDFASAFSEEVSSTPPPTQHGTGPVEFDFDVPEAAPETGTGLSAVIATEGDFTENLPEEGGGDFDFDSVIPEETATSSGQQPDERALEFDFEGSDSAVEPGADTVASMSGEFDFSESASVDSSAGEFTFDEPAAETGSDVDFSGGPGLSGKDETTGPQEIDFDQADTETTGFSEIAFGTEQEESFSFGEQPDIDSQAVDGDDGLWNSPDSGGTDSFDFEEPTFESQTGAPAAEAKEPSLGFGEIDFSDEDEQEAALPSFDSEPNFEQPPPPRAETFQTPPPLPETAKLPPRQPVSRPRSEALPQPPPPRRRPVSKMGLGLGVLLVIICGAGGYLYVSGTAERLIDQAIMKIKGEKPAGPVEQLIGLNNIATSYVNNRDAGQLLVVQGVAVNNFTTARSAIAVKGVLLDGAGKTLQQQTVFCGNYLSDTKLSNLKYSELEEAMSNQFGDSLSNMNVKPGASLKFTIVFRNVPSEIANINFEVVDSKPGSR